MWNKLIVNVFYHYVGFLGQRELEAGLVLVAEGLTFATNNPTTRPPPTSPVNETAYNPSWIAKRASLHNTHQEHSSRYEYTP